MATKQIDTEPKLSTGSVVFSTVEIERGQFVDIGATRTGGPQPANLEPLLIESGKQVESGSVLHLR